MTGATCTTHVTGADLLPALSVAVHETVWSPSKKLDPDGGEQVGVTAPSTLSVALTYFA